MTTVLIVDDLNSIREFLKINLSSEPDIQIVGVAENGDKALSQVEELQPEIVLMDIEMPGAIDGIQATEIIAQRFPHIKVLLLTSQDDKQQLNRALQAGSRGYILKNTSVKDISIIIRLAEKGFFQIGPILGNWNGTLHKNVQSNISDWEMSQSRSKVEAIVQQDFQNLDKSGDAFDMNYVLSNLTSGLFQLQQTIKSQEDTIVNLTNKYSQVQEQIGTKPTREQSVANKPRYELFGFNDAPRRRTQKKQDFLFISSFFLGVVTVLVLVLIIAALNKWF